MILILFHVICFPMIWMVTKIILLLICLQWHHSQTLASPAQVSSTDGAVENLQCVIPQAKFSAKPGGFCDIYTDSVVFQLTKADESKSVACTVFDFDTTCDGIVNAGGCGCREKSGEYVIIDYNIAAVKVGSVNRNATMQLEFLQSYHLPTLLNVLTPSLVSGKWVNCMILFELE